MRRRIRRWAGYTVLAMSVVTMAGLSLLATAPAQASSTTNATVASTLAASTHLATTVTGTNPAAAGSSSTAAPAARHPLGSLTATPPPAVPGAPAVSYVPASCNADDLPAGTARCFADIHSTATGQVKASAAAAGPPSTALGPSDIQSAYNLPASGGAGQTVAIVDAYGDSTAESDLATFRAWYGLPACTTANGCFRKVDQTGGTSYPPDDAGWAGETSLDLDAVSSACPQCHILLVEANTATGSDLEVAEQEAVALGAKFISNSWGQGGESSDETDQDQYFDNPGVVETFASGDSGNLVSYPATDPDVVAVGGTTLTRDAATARGWTESAWGDGVSGGEGGGSGCSAYEPQPSWQSGITNITSVCPDNRAVVDISADADPNTGLAVYDTDGNSGWIQVGGTSLSTPLIAAMYALAGTPAAGTDPASYPYSAPAGTFNDITTGSNGSCGNDLCNAGPGWDGPTGIGTPNGVAGLSLGPVGTISGTVTDAATSAPIAGVTVVATGADGRVFQATTGSSGEYSMTVAAGESYDVSASSYGYADATDSGVSPPDGGTAAADFALHTVPSVTVSGTVTDGGAHGWPLAASITISGYPGGTISTSPYTGRYSVKLPENATYTVLVTSDNPGYDAQALQVNVGTAAVTANAALAVDTVGCTAAGYAYPLSEYFDGWAYEAAPPDGWTVTGTSPGWGSPEFYNINNTGGSGDFAYVNGSDLDTTLTSPVFDLTGQADPELSFDEAYAPSDDDPANASADIQVSTDGGSTWSTVGEPTESESHNVVIPVPQAAGQSDVQVRFHIAGDGLWELDNVTVGGCAPIPGGLVEGVVSDANTGKPVAGATVAGSDPADSNGFTWSFQTTGGHTLTAAALHYTSASGTVHVTPNTVTRRDWRLRAGQLRVSTGSVSLSAPLGGRATTRVRFTNTGGSPVTVTLGTHQDGYTPPSGTTARNAPLRRTPAGISPDSATTVMPQTAKGQASAVTPAASGGWTQITGLPAKIEDNTVGYYEGKVYSVGGVTAGEVLSVGYVYDPVTAAWSPIAPLPAALAGSAGIFLNGTMYVVGGFDSDFNPTDLAFAYNPQANTWASLPPLPQPVEDASVAVLNGQVYVIGGSVGDDGSAAVASAFRYDPATQSWTTVASYPIPVEEAACAGIDHEVVCAGGAAAGDPALAVTQRYLAATYAYNPQANTWVRQADMPYNDYYMAYSGANGRLQVAGGITYIAGGTDLYLTNQAAEFDPVADAWSALPNAAEAFYRAGSSCGFYEVGGSAGSGTVASASVLPGYDLCGGDSVPWLSESEDTVTLAPGQTKTVTLTADAGGLSQLGTYAAKLSLDTESPYSYSPVTVDLTVKPPKSWRHLTGTVTAAGSGTPVSGATVTICVARGNDACGALQTQVQTGANGTYNAWLPPGEPALTVTATAPGDETQSRQVQLSGHTAGRAGFTLADS